MATTRLSQSIGSTDTTLNILPSDGFAINGGIVSIGTEQILYVTASDNQLVGCTRGFNSTVAASHSSQSLVTFISSTPHPDPDNGVDSIQADSNPGITGTVTLASGTGVSLAETGQTITVNATGSGGITQLTGDVTAGPGSGSQPSTLATVNGAPGTFTNASVTVNGKGLVTSASSGTAPVTSVSGTASDISSTGGTTPVLDLINTSVTPGSYTNTNLTVDSKGRITSASSGAGGGATVTSYSPTITGVGTPTSVQFFFKSDGVSVDVWGSFKAGTVASSTFSVSTPANIFTSHLPTTFTILGELYAVEPTAIDGVLFYDGSTNNAVYLTYWGQNTSGSIPNKLNGNYTINTGDYVSVQFSYPIA